MSLGSNIHLVTASTDGQVALWAFQRPDLDLLENSTLLLLNRYPAHQSSIKALSILRINSTEVLVITGGDDNALAVTRLRSVCSQASRQGDDAVLFECDTLCIPKAHAAAINAIGDITDYTNENGDSAAEKDFVVATTSNDQVLRTWKIAVDVLRSGVEGIQVKKGNARASEIADASCIDIVRDNHHEAMAVAIAGIGAEMWTVDRI